MLDAFIIGLKAGAPVSAPGSLVDVSLNRSVLAGTRVAARVGGAAVLALVCLIPFGFDFANPIPAANPGVGAPPPLKLPTLLHNHPTVMTPAKFDRVFLELPRSLDGAGTTIALIEETAQPAYSPGAMNAFDHAFHLPNPNVQVLCAGTCHRAVPTAMAGVETMLDTEWAHVVAPASKLAVIAWAPADGAASLSAMLAKASPDAVAISYGLSGNLAMLRMRLPLLPHGASAYAPLASYPTFVASGDQGSGAALPAMLPWVTAVGGIQYSASYGKVFPWPGAGSGLADLAYSAPSWQTATQSPWREIPDVSWLAGSPGVVIRSNTWIQLGGTSLAAPIWAALWAIVAQERQRLGDPPLPGNPAPYLYELKAKHPGALATPAGVSAAWSPLAGLGYPRPAALINAASSLTPVPTTATPWEIWQLVSLATIVSITAALLVGAWLAIRSRIQHPSRPAFSAGVWVTVAAIFYASIALLLQVATPSAGVELAAVAGAGATTLLLVRPGARVERYRRARRKNMVARSTWNPKRGW